MADKPAQAFLSYAHADDEYLNGDITWLCEVLQRVMDTISSEPFEILADTGDLAFRDQELYPSEDNRSNIRFLIPILTPSYFESPNSRAVADAFLDLEKQSGRQDLILPIYLIKADVIENRELRIADPITRALHERLYSDWRHLKSNLSTSLSSMERIHTLGKHLHAAAASAVPPVPEQGPGVRFRINEDGLIDRAPDEAHDADENEARLNSLKTGLIKACDRLLGSSGHNTLGHVLDTIRAYRSAIDRTLSDVQYTDVWRHGQRLQNLADAATRDVDRLEPSLEDDQHAALNDVLDLHGPFMLSTAEGRALQAMADRYQATREQQERQKEAVQAFKEAIEGSRGLVTDAVKQVIAEASDELGKGRYPERAAITAETTNRNFLSTAGKAAASVGGAAAGGIIGGVAVGTALGGDLIGISVDALNAAGQASKQFFLSHQMTLKGLVACSTDSLAWFNHLIGWLRSGNAANEQLPPKEAPAIIKNDFSTPGYVFRDIDETWCPEMVVIPAGKFIMGSPKGEPGRNDDEGPQHRVNIEKPFALGRFPVTFEEFDFFCDETGSQKPDDEGWGRGRRPVINVRWTDAIKYCDWLTRRSGNTYALPSEAQWEYACRAGSSTAYNVGETIDDEQANFDYHLGKTNKVGSYFANAFKLFDMHGNVWEWCEDLYHPSYVSAPTNGDPWSHGDDGRRVLRGGHWHGNAQNLRSARRYYSPPINRGLDYGFRCVRLQE